MNGLFLLFGLLFVVAQGAAIFTTAYLALSALKIFDRYAKICAMFLSYAVWIAGTIIGYAMIGGEGGLMDGFGLVLFLCFTALVSSALYLAAWIGWPHFEKAANG